MSFATITLLEKKEIAEEWWFYWHRSTITMWNQAGGALVPLWSFLGRKQRDFLLFKLWFSDPNRKTIKPSWINLSEAKLHFVTHSQERGEGGGALSVWPFTVWLMLLLLGSLGTRQRRRSSLLRRMTCKPVSVLWKWPRTYEVSLPQKITLFFFKKKEKASLQRDTEIYVQAGAEVSERLPGMGIML